MKKKYAELFLPVGFIYDDASCHVNNEQKQHYLKKRGVINRFAGNLSSEIIFNECGNCHQRSKGECQIAHKGHREQKLNYLFHAALKIAVKIII
jgi:hypothetical protein